MRLRWFFFPPAIFFGFLAGGPAGADSLDGVWLRGDGNAKVRVAPCGAEVCATNLWIGDTSKGEAPGDKLIMSIRPVSATEFAGTAKDPKRNRTYTIFVTVGRGTMATRGCVLAGLVCKSVEWTKG